jgi:hypothetical protein
MENNKKYEVGQFLKIQFQMFFSWLIQTKT